MQSPDKIIRYAHTLRNAFAPLGKAPGLPQVPPAPQLPFMLCSTLRAYNMELAKQQQQLLPAQPPAAQHTQQQDQQQEAAGAAAVLVQHQQQEVPAEVAAAVPAIQFMLNADLLEDELGSQVEEDFSEDDYSDD